MLPGEVHPRDYVADLLGFQHRPRPLVEHAIVDGARVIVTAVLRGDHPAAHLLTQRLDSLDSDGHDESPRRLRLLTPVSGGALHWHCNRAATSAARLYGIAGPSRRTHPCQRQLKSDQLAASRTVVR